MHWRYLSMHLISRWLKSNKCNGNISPVTFGNVFSEINAEILFLEITDDLGILEF